MTAHHPGIPRDAGHPIRYRAHNIAASLLVWYAERSLRGTPYNPNGQR